METQPPIDARRLSLHMRGLTNWVFRVGPMRATLVLTAAASILSLLFTWIALHLVGHHSMGNAWWISMVVPIPMTIIGGGISSYLLVALERARAEVQELAMQDPLTGLSNRRKFMLAARRELELAARHRQPLAVMMFDVDHFKLINDVHGHAVGDRMLVEVARRCNASLRGTDILARWGGEEFIALLPNTPVEQARQLAERIRESISATAQVQIAERAVRVTVSVGAAGTVACDGPSLEELLQLADQELYKAKRGGRDRVSMSGIVAAALVGVLPNAGEPLRR